jgi:hypothetical protein
MEGNKPAIKSETIGGAVVAILSGASILAKQYFGGAVDPVIAGAAITAIWGGVTAIVGRYKARTTIGAAVSK